MLLIEKIESALHLTLSRFPDAMPLIAAVMCRYQSTTIFPCSTRNRFRRRSAVVDNLFLGFPPMSAERKVCIKDIQQVFELTDLGPVSYSLARTFGMRERMVRDVHGCYYDNGTTTCFRFRRGVRRQIPYSSFCRQLFGYSVVPDGPYHTQHEACGHQAGIPTAYCGCDENSSPFQGGRDI